MYRVLLVDDEVLVRVGMKALIDWEKEGFCIVGEASNGEIALEMIRTEQPDIVLTDVKMPVMDGLELIKKARSCGFSCKFIILSAYDDFKYVKQAFIDDAKDYLLKLELEPDALLKALRKVAEQIPIREEQQKIRSKDPSAVWNAFLDGDNDSIEVLCCPETYQVAAVSVKKSQAMDMGQAVLNMLMEVLENYGTGVWAIDHSGYYVGMICLKNPEELTVFWQACEQMVRYAFNVSCCMGVSKVMEKAGQCREARDQAVNSLESAIFNDCGLLCFQPEYVQKHSGQVMLYEEQFQEMENAVTEFSPSKLREKLEGFLNIFRNEILSPYISIRICNIIHFIMTKCAMQWEISVSDYWNEEMISSNNKSDCILWLETLIEKIRQMEETSYNRLLWKTRRLILENLETDLTLKMVSDKMGYSASHFSKMFKQKTGMGFNAYLTTVRMEQAKRYLQNEDWKIYDIAVKTGYENTAYFSKIFHQQVGMTPVEYRMKAKTSQKAE